MNLWRWIKPALVYAVHDMQLASHGEPVPDAADLAAAYAYGLARNQGFIDGNNRTAWVIARVFLIDNGQTLVFTQLDAVQILQSLAAGLMDEQALAQWFRGRLGSP